MSNQPVKMEIYKYLGITNQQTSHKEKLLSGIGGFISIFAIYFISALLLDPATAVYIIPSLGASAVLLFAAPHVPFSQPWNVLGGHLISAVIGVTCALLINNTGIAAAASVGIAISAMYYTRCTHPPGGATALAAVIGSSKLHDLGYFYIIAPVFLNVTIILLTAILFNALFKWRRYPAYLHNKLVKKPRGSNIQCYEPIKHEDFVYALSQVDSFIDVSETDLLKIYALATGRKHQTDDK